MTDEVHNTIYNENDVQIIHKKYIHIPSNILIQVELFIELFNINCIEGHDTRSSVDLIVDFIPGKYVNAVIKFVSCWQLLFKRADILSFNWFVAVDASTNELFKGLKPNIHENISKSKNININTHI